MTASQSGPIPSKVIAVTGVTGFVGSHLLPALLAQGLHLRALVRNPAKLPQSWRNDPRIDICRGDMNADLSAFVAGVDCVIHMAGLIKAQTRADFMAANADGAANVARAAASANVPRLILLSSMAAREPQLSDYAASKAAGEAAMRAAYEGSMMIIRAPAVFGPGDEATKPIFQLIAKGRLPVLGGTTKTSKLSMIYIKDLVRYIIGSLEGQVPDRPVEPATIANMTWDEFAALCAKALGRPVKVMRIPSIIMTPVAAVTSLTLRYFGAGHLSLQKLAEFRHPDWTSGDEVDNPTPMTTALRETAAAYER